MLRLHEEQNNEMMRNAECVIFYICSREMIYIFASDHSWWWSDMNFLFCALYNGLTLCFSLKIFPRAQHTSLDTKYNSHD